MTTPFPSSLTISSDASFSSANPYDHDFAYPLNEHTPTTKFRTLPISDRIGLAIVAGSMHGGKAIELTINLDDGETWPRVRRDLGKRLRRVGWAGRHCWVEVKRHTKTVKSTGKLKTTQHHVHVIIFDAGPGTAAWEEIDEFRVERSAFKPRSCAVRIKSGRELRSYQFKNVRHDRGQFGADKLTLREAHALARLPAIDLWNRWREAAPVPPKGCEPWPEVPLNLTDRAAVEASTADTRRMKQKARAKLAYDRDQRRRTAVAAPISAPNCFDLLDEIAAADTLAPNASPEPNCFDVLDAIGSGAFDILDDLEIRPAALAGESGPATATRVAHRPEIACPESVLRVSDDAAGRALDPLLAMFRREEDFRPCG